MGSWEHFAHMADIGVRGFGSDVQEAFAQAALAMMAVVSDPAQVRAEKTVKIHCDAPDRELLLMDWLNTLIYEMATRRMLFTDFEVHIDNADLWAKASGEPLDRTRHQPAVELKGATCTELRVTQCVDGRWVAQCVVDV